MRISDWSSDVCSSDLREDVTDPSNFRSIQHFDGWLKSNGRIGLAGVDTRALTRAIRIQGAPNEIGRASGRERVGQYVYISVVADSLKKKKKNERNKNDCQQ